VIRPWFWTDWKPGHRAANRDEARCVCAARPLACRLLARNCLQIARMERHPGLSVLALVLLSQGVTSCEKKGDSFGKGTRWTSKPGNGGPQSSSPPCFATPPFLLLVSRSSLPVA